MSLAKYGSWAAVIGGSEGVGAEFARKLASDGVNLLLVARKPGPLEQIAKEIRGSFPVEVRTMSLDMTADNAVEKIIGATEGLDIGLLILNAGAGVTPGYFVNKDPKAADLTIRLNVTGPTALASHFGPRMAARGRGAIMFVGSGAGEFGTAGLAVYSAAKAYIRTFAEALWYELAPRGVHVSIAILGVTRTPALGRLGYPIDDPNVPGDDPKEVALEALARLADGPVYYAPGAHEDTEMLRGLSRRDAVCHLGELSKEILTRGSAK